MGRTEREHWVPMNDGVRLDLSVCTPDGPPPEGGWPGILLAHGHGDANSKANWLPQARKYAERGYLAASYSVRGQGNSEGLCFHMGPREVFDLQDVVGWILRELPVGKERLGVCGSSQGGWHAWMAAAHCPQVATVVPQNIFTQYDEFAVHKGCLTKWFFTRTMRRRILTAGFQDLMRQWALSGDWHLIREWTRVTSPMGFVERIRCPVFIVHGWHDVGMPPNEVLAMYDRLRVPKKLYLGGGGHEAMDGPEAQAFRQSLIDRWLDHWLKGEPNGMMDEPPITYARRPGWTHVGVEALPPGDARSWRLHLAAGGRLQDEAPTGPATHANVTNRLLRPDYGLSSALEDDLAGVPESLAREAVRFETEPMERPIEILGSPEAQLRMMPNRPALQVHAELWDVAPDGEAELITRGHFGTRTADPGRHFEARIELRTIGYLLEAGHRLRLEVTNCNPTYAYPYFEPFVARLFHDGKFASLLSIPVR